MPSAMLSKTLLSLPLLTILALGAAPKAGQAETVQQTSEREQRTMLLACQDRLYGVPAAGAETYMETTWNQGYPLVRVVPGGVVDDVQARDINSCMARTLGFGGPLGTAASGGFGCPPGFRGMYRGTLYCKS